MCWTRSKRGQHQKPKLAKWPHSVVFVVIVVVVVVVVVVRRLSGQVRSSDVRLDRMQTVCVDKVEEKQTSPPPPLPQKKKKKKNQKEVNWEDEWRRLLTRFFLHTCYQSAHFVCVSKRVSEKAKHAICIFKIGSAVCVCVCVLPLLYSSPSLCSTSWKFQAIKTANF